MRMLNIQHLTGSFPTKLLSGALALGLAAPTLAQRQDTQREERADRQQYGQQQDRQRDDRQRDDRQRDDRQRNDRQRDDRQRDDGQRDDRQRDDGQRDDRQRDDGQRQSRRLSVEPAGWVAIAVDYDRDGEYDAVETIYAYDLDMARRQSQRRENGGQRDGQMRDSREMRDSRSRDQQSVRVEGEVQNLRKIRMHDEDSSYLIAHVRTDRGQRAKVLLGKQEQLSRLDLREGDAVQVQGRRGTINQQTVLVASQVRSGDQQIKVQPKKRLIRAKREHIRGSVVRMREARFRGHDGVFLVAEVRTDDGQRRTVNMGPQDKFDDVNFARADQVRVLGHEGKISGDKALIAEQVHVNGQTIKIKPDQRRDRQWQKQQRDR